MNCTGLTRCGPTPRRLTTSEGPGPRRRVSGPAFAYQSLAEMFVTPRQDEHSRSRLPVLDESSAFLLKESGE